VGQSEQINWPLPEAIDKLWADAIAEKKSNRKARFSFPSRDEAVHGE
jgi:hypothetical protein